MQDLASGFVFGEVLHRCKLQPDFNQFEDSRAPTAIFNNYRRLQVGCYNSLLACILLLVYSEVVRCCSVPKGLTGLQPTLQKLGIQLSKHKVAALTREEKDVSVQLLYRIKSALATVNASIAHAQGMNTSKLAATFGMKTELSKGLVEAQQFRYDT